MKLNPHLDSIETYVAGKPIELVMRDYKLSKDKIIKLASNENPYGCSALVKEDLIANIGEASIYPDDSFFELKEKLARYHNIAPKNIIIGSGSDQVIEFCVRLKENTTSDFKVLHAGLTFAMYDIYSKLSGAKPIATLSNEHNLDEMYELYCKYRPSIIFLCLPNNPLGECLDASEVNEFIDKIDIQTLIIIDGAYQEYASYKDKAKALRPSDYLRCENVVYLGTFSKAFGLGGMRVGYGIANENLIALLHKIRPPFNISSLALRATCKALEDLDFVQKCLEQNFLEMKKYEDFAKSYNIGFINSYTNFITFLLQKGSSSAISNELLSRGVIIRDLASYGLNAIRITIGTPVQNMHVFEELGRLLG